MVILRSDDVSPGETPAFEVAALVAEHLEVGVVWVGDVPARIPKRDRQHPGAEDDSEAIFVGRRGPSGRAANFAQGACRYRDGGDETDHPQLPRFAGRRRGEDRGGGAEPTR